MEKRTACLPQHHPTHLLKKNRAFSISGSHPLATPLKNCQTRKGEKKRNVRLLRGLFHPKATQPQTELLLVGKLIHINACRKGSTANEMSSWHTHSTGRRKNETS